MPMFKCPDRSGNMHCSFSVEAFDLSNSSFQPRGQYLHACSSAPFSAVSTFTPSRLLVSQTKRPEKRSLPAARPHSKRLPLSPGGKITQNKGRPWEVSCGAKEACTLSQSTPSPQTNHYFCHLHCFVPVNTAIE